VAALELTTVGPAVLATCKLSLLLCPGTPSNMRLLRSAICSGERA
jgi:hypothetical protein